MTDQAVEAPTLDSLIIARGAATHAELGLKPEQLLAMTKKRPDLEPVFLVRFRSRQGKVRVEEVRAYAWPSQQLSLRHLGYQAEDQRLLRVEPRQPVPFPQRLYTRFQDNPKVIEELRTLEKNYGRAVKQAPSKPGRCEMDLLPLQVPFKKLGDDIVLEMWIDAASTFQRIENQTYAGKMLGNLLKVAEKSKVEPSLLARTVLTASDDGVFNTKLYEYTWAQLQKKSTQTALGFGLRVFRRLMSSGRPLPTDFVKDLRNGAIKGKVTDFEPLFDSTVLWACGLASFWNTAKKSATWEEEHKETSLLRNRLVDLWVEASKREDGEAWKAQVWQRIRGVMPELSVYGRFVVVQRLVQSFDKQEATTRADFERLLEATLSLLARSPSSDNRRAFEECALKALERIAKTDPELLWASASIIEEGLQSASGQITSFVAMCDMLSDVSELLGERDGKNLLESMPGLTSAWTAALVSALADKKKNDDDDDDDDGGSLPIVSLIGEALGRYTPETAPEQLAELGPLLAKRIGSDLSRDSGLAAWERVFGTLKQLGPIGDGIISEATARFIKRDGKSSDFKNVAPVVHLLDTDALRPSGEARSVLDEALEDIFAVAPHGVETKFKQPDGFNEGEVKRSAANSADGKGFELLYSVDDYDDDKPRQLVLAHVGLDGALEVVASAKHTYSSVALWVHPEGVRVILGKDRIATVLDSKLKVLKKLEVDEDFGGSYGDVQPVAWGQYALLARRNAALCIDWKLNPIGESESTDRYGEWSLLEGPKGSGPVAVFTHGGERLIFTAPGQKAAALKLPDGGSVDFYGRQADGSIFANYTNKKGVNRRATLSADGASWAFADATADLNVLDTVGLPFDVRGAATLGYAKSGNNGAQFFDWQGQNLGCTIGSAEEDNSDDPIAINYEAGVSLYPRAVIRDAGLHARLGAAADLRAAKTNVPAEPLARPLYRDVGKLATHLLEQLALRPAGKKALETLGASAPIMMTEAAKSLTAVLEARATVLEAIDAPARPVLKVPSRVPGIPRTEVRRTIRDNFSGDELAFWALDANEPGPFVQAFVSNEHIESGAFAMLKRLLQLAQSPKSSVGIAERCLNTAELIIAQVKNPALKLALDTSSSDCSERVASFIGGRGPFLFPNRGSYAKKVAPIEMADGDTRKELLAKWIQSSLLGPLKPSSVVWRRSDSRSCIIKDDYEEVDQFVAKVTFGGTEFNVYPAARRSADGLEWWLDGLKGSATATEWTSLCKALADAVNACQPKDEFPVWPDDHVRSEDLEVFVKCVEFTRSSLAQREALSPLNWPAPPQEGLLKNLDERQRRWVLLTWVFGELRPEKVSSTSAAFDALAKQCKAVTKNYYGLKPKQGEKTDDDVVLSAEFQDVRLRCGIGSDLDDLLLVRDPGALVVELASAAGLLGDDSGKKGKK